MGKEEIPNSNPILVAAAASMFLFYWRFLSILVDVNVWLFILLALNKFKQVFSIPMDANDAKC
jgi:hypothetical protein